MSKLRATSKVEWQDSHLKRQGKIKQLWGDKALIVEANEDNTLHIIALDRLTAIKKINIYSSGYTKMFRSAEDK
jgi:hypothetical protein